MRRKRLDECVSHSPLPGEVTGDRTVKGTHTRFVLADKANIILGRVVWAGPLTVLASVAAVQCVRVIAVVLLHPARTFAPLLWPPPIIDTVILVTAAVIVFSAVASRSSSPIRTFRTIAAAVLLLSFVPDILLALWHSFGGSWPEAAALMAMHVVAWAVTVTMLMRLTTVPTDIGGR
jgi:hypothetical protein